MLNTKLAAKLIAQISKRKLSVRRLEEIARDGGIPAIFMSGRYIFEEDDVRKFALNRPKVGRPRKK